ncbi:Flp pilus assembly protein TadB [Lentzea albidocapillata subsp. violacea]|uniref:Flp pilus assembly protein TadB n=1 Tax=Lentzea albidocapillata subsp. violacea TaxID=128104 RepID=A0A1G9RU76_9PSEU|nr:type II secretion system F family protein [Lentzea albidocapillata]SDM26630.1 Flp pilus assembly protein TadB [Lentzea albidocapillata subsp. violacea]
MNVSLGTAQGLAVLLGLGTGLGVLLFVIGWHGVEQRPRLWRARPRSGEQRQRFGIRFGVALAVGVAAGVATGWVVGAVLAGMACWALPRVLGRDPEHAHRVAKVEAIATWTEMLRDTLSAASGLEQAILATAPLAPAPIRGQVAGLARRLENGQRLAPSLRGLADELADPTGDLVIAALVKAAEQQARQLGELLGALAQTAREQVSMRMRVEAGRARTRTSVRVIVGTTLVFAVAVVLLNRPYLSAYDSVTGQAVLLGIGLLFAVGFAWLARITRIAQSPRLLASAQAPMGERPRPVAEGQV